MGKKLKLYERILLILALAADAASDIYLTGVLMPKRAYWEGWRPKGFYKKRSIYQAYQYLLKTGAIDKIIRDNKPYIRFTSKTNLALKRDFSILQMQKQKWDRQWRLVIFDIEEKEKAARETLRKKLIELGFASLQRSIYISPYNFNNDVYEYLRNQGLLGSVLVLTAKHELLGDEKSLARQLWKLDCLEQKYNELITEIKQQESRPAKSKVITSIRDRYLGLLQRDPFLPYELLPEDWPEAIFRQKILAMC